MDFGYHHLEGGLNPLDLDGDGWTTCDGDIDLVTVDGGDHSIHVLENDGAGFFTEIQVVAAAGGHPHPHQVADVDNDFDLDVIAPIRDGEGCVSSWPTGCNQIIEVFLNDGSGQLTSGGVFTGNTGPHSSYANDLDGDGFVDAAIPHQWHDDFDVFVGDGDGSFTHAGSYDAEDLGAYVIGGDFDADGDIDLAIPIWDGHEFRTYRNDGTAVYTSSQIFALDHCGSSVAAGDLNGDGTLDLVATACAWGGNSQAMIYLNTP